jgi:hypothetical protein
MNRTIFAKIGLVFGTALLGVLTGCVGHADRPHHGRVYAHAPPTYVTGQVVVQDDYVYYPGYQVYYSNNRRQYIYRNGSAWVSRPAPPRVSVDVLFASPSVSLDFHDHPSVHHATVVKQYPKRWAPPGANRGNKYGHDKDNNRGQKGRD